MWLKELALFEVSPQGKARANPKSCMRRGSLKNVSDVTAERLKTWSLNNALINFASTNSVILMPGK